MLKAVAHGGHYPKNCKVIFLSSLSTSDDEHDQAFMLKLVESWRLAATEGAAETRTLYDLVTVLQSSGFGELARRLTPALRSRATARLDGWMAALQLWFLSADEPSKRSFPPDLDLAALIDVADFSIASSRALEFAGRLVNSPA